MITPIVLLCLLMRNGKRLIAMTSTKKIDKVIEILSEHPFVVSNPSIARNIAKFRIYSLKKYK